jgi:hypothetical protein
MKASNWSSLSSTALVCSPSVTGCSWKTFESFLSWATTEATMMCCTARWNTSLWIPTVCLTTSLVPNTPTFDQLSTCYLLWFDVILSKHNWNPLYGCLRSCSPGEGRILRGIFKLFVFSIVITFKRLLTTRCRTPENQWGVTLSRIQRLCCEKMVVFSLWGPQLLGFHTIINGLNCWIRPLFIRAKPHKINLFGLHTPQGQQHWTFHRLREQT